MPPDQPVDELDPAGLAALRAGLDALAAAVARGVPVAEVRDEQLALPDRSLPLRSYRPVPAGLRGGDEATLLWFHGGGYIAGSLEAIDPVCRVLASRLGCRVVSVGYRLAPEHPYPAAVHDALAALDHVARTAGGRLAVGGDSAGGGLSAAVARRRTHPVAGQLLLCPWLDLTGGSPSMREKAEGFGLTAAQLRGFARLYLGPGGDPLAPGASPLLDDLTGLPPTAVVTAGDDPLRDEGERYAEGIVAAGGTARARRWEGMPHGFVGMTADLPAATEALEWACAQLREWLRLPDPG